MRTTKLLLFTLSFASLAVLPSIQHQSAKGPQFALQEPMPVKFVEDILSNNDVQDYCNVRLDYNMT